MHPLSYLSSPQTLIFQVHVFAIVKEEYYFIIQNDICSNPIENAVLPHFSCSYICHNTKALHSRCFHLYLKHGEPRRALAVEWRNKWIIVLNIESNSLFPISKDVLIIIFSTMLWTHRHKWKTLAPRKSSSPI